MSKQEIKAVKLKAPLVAGLSALDEVQEEYAAKQIDKYISERKPKYLMMMNHDIRYFTVFDLKSKSIKASMGKEIINFTRKYVEPTYGHLKLVDAESTMAAVEVWCGKTCFILFDYTNGVVEL